MLDGDVSLTVTASSERGVTEFRNVCHTQAENVGVGKRTDVFLVYRSGNLTIAPRTTPLVLFSYRCMYILTIDN